tara:strand:- start:21783 stop:21953 length:171 start_codon:yes stop_codon:yes gene_type:complete
MKTVIFLIVFAYGCTPTQIYKTGSAVHHAGCVVTTEEWRARKRLKIPTDLCGDLKK